MLPAALEPQLLEPASGVARLSTPEQLSVRHVVPPPQHLCGTQPPLPTPTSALEPWPVTHTISFTTLPKTFPKNDPAQC